MNNLHNRGPHPSQEDHSALSLLVNAADTHDTSPRMQRDLGGMPGRSLADTLRLRGLAGDAGAAALEEQLLLQQQSQAYGNQNLLSQLRDQNLLAQLGQQQHLASLLGLGGGGSAGANEMRNAIAAAQLRQHQAQAPQHQLTQADLIALSRSGALPSLSGLLGGNGGFHGGGGGLASELEGLQRLEEFERRQRLLNASPAGPIPSAGLSSRGGGGGVETMPEPPQLHPIAPSAQRVQNEPRAEAPSSSMQQQQQQSRNKNNDRRPSDAVASAPASANEVPPKEEVEKTPGSVIVPCRARGMPMDHNFKTAYFVIPENVKHGEELICSYFACRNAGIKFRYCSHCKVPVAKRNFRKRHKHGGEIAAGEDSGGEEEASIKKGIPSQIVARREDAVEADALSSQSADSVNDGKHMTETDVQKGLVRSSMRSFEEAKREEPAPAAAIEQNKKDPIGSDRKQRWAALLSKRPSTKDGDSMSNWLMEVLAVSDLETPLKAGEAPQGGKANSAAITHSAVVAGSESPRSESASSDDESSGGDKKKSGMAGNFNGGGVIMKKQRPPDFLSKKRKTEQVEKPVRPGAFAGGSFAEWKERKKQRKQTKTSGNPASQQEPV